MPMDYAKTPSDEHVTVWVGPTSAVTGVADTAVPTAAELNNTGQVSGMLPASQSISWNDWDFGMEASETVSEPSLADAATYEEFGAANYGGNISYWMPRDYDDNSNNHSLIYDITDEPGALNDIGMRIDGAIKTTVPAANGDFASIYRAQGTTEQNPFTPGESVRRTVGYISKGDFARYTIVGPHTITAVPPGAFAAGSTGRIRATVQNRDYTNALKFTTDDGAVIDVWPGGFFQVTGTASDTATVTIEDEGAGTSTTVAVTVS